MKTKTSSVRLPKEMYEKIDTVCDDIGCSRNDWFKDAVETKLLDDSENTQDQEVIRDTMEPEKLLRTKGKIKSINRIPLKFINVKLVHND